MTNKRKLSGWMINLVLVGFGLIMAGSLMLAIFAMFPQFRPGVTVFTVAQGDIFFHQAKWIKVPENPNEILAVYTIGWDEDGFRIPERQADYYPILAIGDSFTEAPNAGRPWTDVLAAEGGLPVRNLAYRGFGPVEEARILELFGPDSNAETVIIGYFEGNDLSNAYTAQGQEMVMPADIPPANRQVIETDLDAVTDRDERYPMLVSLNGVDHEIAFFEAYAWALNATDGSFRRSLNMQLTVQSYQEMRAAMPDACMIVAYFPTKPHVYLPYLKPEFQPILMQKVEQFAAEPGQTLQLRAATDTTFENLLNRLNNQRDVFKAEMEAIGLVFFDLTPVLAAAAARGEMVYYTYDTHWNQAGHDLVGQAIADFLETDPCHQLR